MKKLNKILSALLVFALLISTMCSAFTAYAEATNSFDISIETDQYGAIDSNSEQIKLTAKFDVASSYGFVGGDFDFEMPSELSIASTVAKSVKSIVGATVSNSLVATANKDNTVRFIVNDAKTSCKTITLEIALQINQELQTGKEYEIKVCALEGYFKDDQTQNDEIAFTPDTKSVTFHIHGKNSEIVGCPACDALNVKETAPKPEAPTKESVTDTTVTLVQLEGYEYKIEGGQWQTSNVFDGLLPLTEYTFYQRTAETDTHYESASSDGVKITTDKPKASVPNAPELLSKTETSITLVKLIGYEYKCDDGNWQSSNVFTDLSPATEYTFYQRIAENDEHYAGDSSIGKVISTNKLTALAPNAPTKQSVTDTTVTLLQLDGYEYKCGTGEWQESNVFTGLAPNTRYTFYQRIAETDTHYASATSAGTNITTDKTNAQKPDVPTLSEKDETSITLTKIEGYEYKRGNGAWQKSNVFKGLKPNTEYTFYQRVAESDSNYVSPSSSPARIKTSMQFSDVSKSGWYYNAVKFVTDNGYFSGYANSDKFGTSDNIQRQDFVVALARLDGVNLDTYSGSTSFADVPKGSYYAKAVQWASENGIVTGYSHNNKFGVGDNITREQLVTMFYRYIKNYKGEDVSISGNAAAGYPDYSKVSVFSKDAVDWAIAKGVISGKNGNIAPVANAQRCEVAMIIYNMFQNGILHE